MKNFHLQYKIILDEKSFTYAQAYVKAEDHMEAEKKLAKFLGKKVKFQLTQFADANADIIA